jgi:hypothetical protein
MRYAYKNLNLMEILAFGLQYKKGVSHGITPFFFHELINNCSKFDIKLRFL